LTDRDRRALPPSPIVDRKILVLMSQDDDAQLPVGSKVWVPASATQLQYKTPAAVRDDSRIAYLPATVSSTERGEFTLVWDPTVRVKCAWNLIEARGPKRHGEEEREAIFLDDSEATLPDFKQDIA